MDVYYVYRFFNINNEIVYVGKTNNIDSRMRQHFSDKGHLKPEQYAQVQRVEYTECPSQLDMDILEKYLINLWQPPFNTVDRNSSISFFDLKNTKELKWIVYFNKSNNKVSAPSPTINDEEEKLKKLKEEQESFIKELGVSNIIPENYIVYSDGIKKVKRSRSGNIIGYKNISGTPIFINRVEKDYDTHTEKTVLIFYIRGKLEKKRFPSEELISINKIINNFGKIGVSIDNSNARHVSEYIRLLKDLNCNKIEDNYILFNNIGWKNNENFFAYPTPENKQIIVGKLENNANYVYSEEIKEKFLQADNTKEYKEAFLKIFDKNVYTQLACLTSLSGPFLQLMSTPNILLYFYGNFSSSKTAIMKFAQSAWYNANANVVSFNATSIALDNTMAQYSGTTLLIDEIQSFVKGGKFQEKALTQFMYSAINGIGRVRGKISQSTNNGLLVTVPRFRLSIMVTSEDKLIENNVKNKILEIPIKNQIFTQDEVNEIDRVISLSYGGLGIEFLKKALDLIKAENVDLIKDNFNLQTEISKQVEKNGISGLQINMLATLAIVDYYLRRTIFHEDIQLANKHMMNLIRNINELLTDREDEATKNLIDEFCTEYNSLIKDIKNTDSSSNTKVYGYKVYNEFSGNIKYYISTHILEEYFDNRDENLKKLIKELYKKGLVEKYNETYKIKKSFKGTNISGIFYVYTKKY